MCKQMMIMKGLWVSKGVITGTGKVVSVLVIASLLLALFSVPALAIPQVPNQFYGEVRVGSNPASATPDGVQVQAKINGVTYAATTTKSGKYGYEPVFLVPADDPDTRTKEGGVSGDTVAFYVEGVSAGSYTFATGGSVQLHLVVTVLAAPSAPTSIARATPANDNMPTFTWSAPAYAPGTVASYEVNIDSESWVDIGNVTTHTGGIALSDSSHTFQVRAVDAFGSQGTPGSLSFTVDATPPTTPGNLSKTTPANDNTPTFTWAAATDATSGVVSYEARTDTGTYTDIGNVTTYTYPVALSDGSRTFDVRARDAAGNSGTAATLTFTIDITAPDIPGSITKTTLDNDNTPTFTWSAASDATSGIATYKVRIDATGAWIDVGNVTLYTQTTAISDGSHVFYVRAEDVAGNIGTAGTLVFAIDATAPDIPGDIAKTTPNNDNTPTFTWSAAADAASGVAFYEVKIGTGSYTDIGNVTTYTAAALSDGSHTFYVRAKDTAGNTGGEGSLGFTVDTAVPEAPALVSPADGARTNDTTPIFDWSDVADPSGVSYSLQIDDSSDLSSPVVSKPGLTSSQSELASGEALSQGTYYWRVRVVDGAGNNSAWTTARSLSIDTSPPGALSLASPVDGARTNDTTPAFDWSDVTDPSGVSYNLQVDDESNFLSLVISQTGLSSSTYTPETALAEGTYYWRVRSVDEAGNESSWTSAWSFVIDTTAPNPPSNLRKTTPDNDNTPTFAWDAVADAVAYEVRIDTEPYTNIDDILDYMHTSSLSDGSHTFYVRALDVAGNASTATGIEFVVDIVSPAIPFDISRTTAANNNIPTFTWSAAVDVTSGIAFYEVRIDTDSYENIGNVTAYTHTAALSDGSHTFYVRAKDAAGNTGAAGSLVFAIDVTPPTAPSSIAKTTLDNNNTPTFTWSAAEDVTSGVVSYEANMDGGAYSDTGNITTYTHTVVLSDGSHIFYVRARDVAGNTGSESSLAFTVDATPPTAPTNIAQTTPENDNTPAFTWEASADATSGVASYEVKMEKGSYTDIGNVTTYTHTVALSDESYTLYVRALDAAGNRSSESSLEFTIDTTAPDIPELASPDNEAKTGDTTPTFEWSSVADPSGVSYRLQVDDNADFITPVIDEMGLIYNTYTPVSELSDSLYYWRVEAGDGVNNESGWTDHWSFRIDTTVPDTPALLSPTDGYKTNDNTPTFDWADVADPSGVTYHLQMDDSADLSSPVISETGLASSSYTPVSGLPDRLYYWRARAIDGVSNQSAWTSSWQLTVDITLPTAPANILKTTPDNDNTPAFSWNAAADVTAGVASYQVRVDTGSWTDIGNVTTYTLSIPLSDGDHTFYVRAKDGAGNIGGAVSSVFTIDATVPTAPSNIIKVTPDTDNTPTFTWGAAQDALSGMAYYEVRVDSDAYTGIGNVTSYTVPGPLSEGSHVFKVRAVDRAGNVGTAGSIIFAISPPLPPPPTTTPLPPNFQLSDLAVSPSVVNAGVPVAVTVKISNTGETSGDYQVDLVVDNVIESSAQGTLAAGTTRTLSFSIVRNAAGTHMVAAGDLATSFTIPPANIQISNLVVSPRTVGRGDEVRISFLVANSGGASGAYNVTLSVGGVEEDSANGISAPGDSVTVLFTTARIVPGTYSVAVDGLVSSFVVVAPMVEVSLPPESTVNMATTSATDAAGEPVSLSGDTVALEEMAEGELEIEFPVSLSAGEVLSSFTDATSGITFSGNQVTIPVRDAAGNIALNIVATTENAVGTGTAARARVTDLALRTEERETDLSLDDPSLGRVSVSIEADLHRLPSGAALTVTTKKTLSPEVRSGFELVAREEDGTIADVGVAIEIEKQNLENVAVVGEARLTMKVSAGWVNKYGLEKLKVARLADDGAKEWLTPTLMGTDAEGRMIFEVVSPNGLSIFSLVTVVPLPAEFVIANMSITPEIAQPNEWVEIKAQVSNAGAQEGTYSLVLKIDGTAVDSQSITLPGGQSGWVSFFIREAEERTYQVQLEGLSGSFQATTLLGTSSVAVANLVVSPAEVNVGESTAVSVMVTNLSDASGRYDVVLKLNNIVVEVKTAFLAARETKQVEFHLVKDVAGTYSVDVNGLAGSFIVTELLTPATFSLSNLIVEPLKVAPGKTVSIKVTLSNSGDLAGSKDVTLTINGVAEEVKPVTVEGKGSVVVAFTVAEDVPGFYQVAVDGLTATFTVKKPFNWLLAGGIIGGVVVLAAVLMTVLTLRRRPTPAPAIEEHPSQGQQGDSIGGKKDEVEPGVRKPPSSPL